MNMRSSIVLALSSLLSLGACGGAQPAPRAQPSAHAHAHAHPAAHAHAAGARPTEEFRAHHAEIRVALDEAAARAMALPSAPPEEAGELIHGIVHFFHHVLVPHAEAEERVLYAVADRLVPTAHGRRYTDSLRYEHTIVAREVRALHEAMQRGDHSPDARAEIQRRTLGLVGLVEAHFGAEEDVILAAFDELMSAEEFQREVVAPMEESGGHDAHAH